MKKKIFARKNIEKTLHKYGLHQYLRKAHQDLHSLVMGLGGNHQYIYSFKNILLAKMTISSGLLSILNLHFIFKPPSKHTRYISGI